MELIYVFSFQFNFLFSAALEEDLASNNGNGTEKNELSQKQRHQMKHRELFLSRQVETLPATHIRGKCSVTLLNEEESLLSYLNKDVSSNVGFHKKVSKCLRNCL